MCGIFGFIGKSSLRTSLLLQTLAIADEVRGRDSTGIMVFQRHRSGSGTSYIQKAALPGRKFVINGWTEFLFAKKLHYSAALGHNRAATTGAINKRNAHPFGWRVRRKWHWGIHNGVIHNWREVCSKFDVKKTPGVDSEAVFWAIGNLMSRGMSTESAIAKVTEYISGDFAFAMLSRKEGIWLWCNGMRPLEILDARPYGLGRWLCSTKDIFTRAWGFQRGLLGNPGSLTSFSANPYTLYLIPFGKDSVVETVRQLNPRRERRLSGKSYTWSDMRRRIRSGKKVSQQELFGFTGRRLKGRR